MSSSSPQGSTSFAGDPARNRSSATCPRRRSGSDRNASRSSGVKNSKRTTSCPKAYEARSKNMSLPESRQA